MFGQYGIDGTDSLPYAEIFTVDVHGNTFTSQGVMKKSFTTPPQPGQDGSGALLSLFWEAKEPAGELKISPLLQGRLVYLLVNGEEPKSQIAFRDFRLGSQYKVSLNQEQFSSSDGISAAFHINLTVTDSGGTIKTYTIGLPDYKRKGVKRYKIRQVLFSPDEASLVFIVEREEEEPGGAANFRFMVETVKLD